LIKYLNWGAGGIKYSLHLIKKPISVNWLVTLQRREGGRRILELILELKFTKKVNLKKDREDWCEPALDIHALLSSILTQISLHFFFFNSVNKEKTTLS